MFGLGKTSQEKTRGKEVLAEVIEIAKGIAMAPPEQRLVLEETFRAVADDIKSTFPHLASAPQNVRSWNADTMMQRAVNLRATKGPVFRVGMHLAALGVRASTIDSDDAHTAMHMVQAIFDDFAPGSAIA